MAGVGGFPQLGFAPSGAGSDWERDEKGTLTPGMLFAFLAGFEFHSEEVTAGASLCPRGAPSPAVTCDQRGEAQGVHFREITKSP